MAPPMGLVFLRHWSVGAGEPVTVTVNEVGWPAHTVEGEGEPEKPGPLLTVRIAAALVTLPQELVATQS